MNNSDNETNLIIGLSRQL